VQKRVRNAIAVVATAAVAAAGVAGVMRYRRGAVSAHAIDAIPAGALLVATADLAGLRASPVGAPFLREGREIPGLGKVRDVCGFDPMDTLTEVALAIPAAGEAGEFGLVASGPIDDDALVACASKVIDARGGRAVTTTVGSFRSVRDATLTLSGGEIAVRRGGPLLLGAGAYLRAMIDAADGRSPGIGSSVAHGFLSHQVGDASIRATLVLSPELRHVVAEELASGGAAGAPEGSILAGAVGVQLGPAVGVHLVVSCATAEACASLADKLGKVRAERAADPATRVVGFGAVLDQITIAAEGTLIHARVELPADLAGLLADRLINLRGIRHPMRAHDEVPAPSPPPPPDEVVKPTPGSAAPRDAGAPR